MSDALILKKWENPDKENFTYIRQYLLCKEKDVSRLAMRLHHGGKFVLTGIYFLVQGFDGNRNYLGERTFLINNLFVLPNTEFIAPDLKIPKTWKEIAVSIIRVYSEDYAYYLENDEVKPLYCGVEAKNTKNAGFSSNVRVKKRKKDEKNECFVVCMSKKVSSKIVLSVVVLCLIVFALCVIV